MNIEELEWEYGQCREILRENVYLWRSDPLFEYPYLKSYSSLLILPKPCFYSKTNVLFQLKQLERLLVISNIRQLGMCVIMKKSHNWGNMINQVTTNMVEKIKHQQEWQALSQQ